MKENSVSLDIRNIKMIAIEIFRFSNVLSPRLMKNIFKLKGENSENLRQGSDYSRTMVNSVYHAAQFISSLWQKIWYILPEKLDNIGSIKKEIKAKKTDNWACRLYKVFIESLEFLKLYTV